MYAAPRPDLILLDLDLPRKDGRAVLAEIKANRRLRAIPIIVLADSEQDGARRLCYEMGAAAFVPKPQSPGGYTEMLRILGNYWFGTACLPRQAIATVNSSPVAG
jgi:CheY-like chemotaxis protein